MDSARLTTVLQAHAGELGTALVQAVQARAPVNQSPEPQRTPGTLRDSFGFEVEADSDGLVINVTSTDTPVVWYVLQGTSPHQISAVNTRALRFTVKDGTLVFARHVSHPGTQANDFVTAATDDIESALAPIHEQIMQEWLDGMAEEWQVAA